MKKQHIYLAIFLYICAVFYLAITTPISPHEAHIFYESNDIVSTLMHWGENTVGGFLALESFLSSLVF